MPWALPKDTAEAVGPRASCIKNRSLYADKYAEFPEKEGDKTARSRTIERIVADDFDNVEVLGSRRNALEKIEGVESFVAELKDRMMVNHAGGVIENGGLALDRNSGIPYIPGTALKGIARRGAVLEEATDEEMDIVFGWSDSRNRRQASYAGMVAFLAAYPVGQPGLERDIVTVHHHNYYQQDPPQPAFDNEEPIPNMFPVVKAESKYHFFLVRIGSARRKQAVINGDPLKKAKKWLIAGLTEIGIGAKTATGYGWFEYDEEADRKRAEEEKRALREAAEERARAEAEAARLSRMSPLDRETERITGLDDNGFAQLVGRLNDESELVQQAVIKTMSKAKADKWNDWKKRKTEKTRKRADMLEEIARKHGMSLP